MNFAELKAVADVLKKRFPSLTVEETLDLANAVLTALGRG